jgi:hypothetical protein
VAVGGELVPLHGDVKGAADVASVQRLDLFAQQVTLERGMPPFGKAARVIVHPAVVAAGEDVDGVDARPLQRGGELLGVEGRADAGNGLGRMEVEVDLAETKFFGCVGHGRSSPSARARGRSG